jgi:hypothetical protein
MHGRPTKRADAGHKREKAGQKDRPFSALRQRVGLAAAILGQLLAIFRRLGGCGRIDCVLIQALLEGANAFTEALAHACKPTRSEQEQDDD